MFGDCAAKLAPADSAVKCNYIVICPVPSGRHQGSSVVSDLLNGDGGGVVLTAIMGMGRWMDSRAHVRPLVLCLEVLGVGHPPCEVSDCYTDDPPD